MILSPLFHWSPSERREEILRDGLRLYSQATVSAGTNPELGTIIAGWPHVCLGTTPSSAWRLSGEMDYGRFSEIERWDLWEVRLADTDEIHVRAEWGPDITEVRIGNSVPADRVWWVAFREPLCAKEVPGDG